MTYARIVRTPLGRLVFLALVAGQVSTTACGGSATSNQGSDPSPSDELALDCNGAASDASVPWKPLTAAEQVELTKKHLRGSPQARAACLRWAMMSSEVVLLVEATEPPRLSPLSAPWQAATVPSERADKIVESLQTAFPRAFEGLQLDESDGFEDGRGNFIERYLLETDDGDFVLVVAYAG